MALTLVSSEKTLQADRTRALCLLLRALRRDKKLTQQQLAARLGKPQSFVAKYEAGERQLDVAEWLAIVEAMDADPIVFLRVLLTPMPRKDVPARRK